jgi:hypothetical protein
MGDQVESGLPPVERSLAWIEAHANSAAGLTLEFADDLTGATARLNGAIAYYRAAGTEPDTQLILALFFLGYAMCLRRDTARAITLFAEGETLCHARSERWALSWTLWGLGLARWIRNELGEAVVKLREGLSIKYALHDLAGVLLSAECLAWTLAAEGDATRAARLLGGTRALWAPIGAFLYGHKPYLDWRDTCEARGRRPLGDHAFEAAYQQGVRSTSSPRTRWERKRRRRSRPGRRSRL